MSADDYIIFVAVVVCSTIFGAIMSDQVAA